MEDDEWVRRTAHVLAARDTATAMGELASTLLTATHARVAVRVDVRVIGGLPAVDLSVHARGATVPDEIWRRESLDPDNPFPRYYAESGDRRPRSLAQVRSAGYELSHDTIRRMRRLGVTEHQLACPISGTLEAYRGWTFLGDEPYTDLDVERITQRHDLIVGLDGFAQRLAEAPRHGRTPGPAEARPAAHPRPRDGQPEPPGRNSRQRGQHGSQPEVRLTPGESRVLAMMHAGFTAPAMATRLGISPRTVHKHQERIYRKLEATDRLSAVLAAKRLRLLPDQHRDDLDPAGAQPGAADRAG